MLPGSIRSKSKYQVVAFSKDGESAKIIWSDWEESICWLLTTPNVISSQHG
jgi:hypothetical protein